MQVMPMWFTCIALILAFAASAIPASACGGRLVQVSDGRDVAVETMIDALSDNARLLLGERHGIADHPRIAGCLIEKLAARSTVTLVLEHVRKDQQAVLDHYRASHPEFVAGLGTKLGWWQSGWPAWKIYLPLFEAAWRDRVPVIAGDRAPSALSPALQPLDDALIEAWGQAMGAAHCGLADAGRMRELGILQVHRDRSMAASVAAAAHSTVILYAGRSHIRRDRGVPRHLDPANGAVVSIALQEKQEGDRVVNQEAALAAARGVFDYLWFTDGIAPRPICAQLQEKGLVR